MQYTWKSRNRTNVQRFRPRVESFEDRVQPGNLLVGGSFSPMGMSLFDQDPLTGRPLHSAAADQRLLDALPSGSDLDLSGLVLNRVVVDPSAETGGSEQVQPAVATVHPNDDLALAAAVNGTTAPQGKLANVVETVQPDSFQNMRPGVVTAVRPLTSQRREGSPATNRLPLGDDPSIQAITVYTSFLGFAGEDRSNAVATDSLEYGYVAGYSTIFGTKDIRVTVAAPDGTSLVADIIYFDFDLGGDEEATGIAVDPDTGATWIAGYQFNGVDNDILVAQLDLAKGTVMASTTVDSGLGDDRANGIRLVNGELYVTGQVADGAGGSDVAILKYDGALNNIYGNSFKLGSNPGNNGDAIDAAADGTAYVVGTTNDGSADHLFAARLNAADGSVDHSLVRTDTSIGGGVAVAEEGGFTVVYLTGNILITTPATRINGLITKLLDNGTSFTGLYSRDFGAAIAEGPLDITGTDLRVTSSGKAVIMAEWYWPLCCGLPYRDRDAHVYKLSADGTAFQDAYHWGIEFFEALGLDSGSGIALNGTTITAVGYAGTTPAPGGFPVTPGVFQDTHADGVYDISDGFVSRINLDIGG